MPAPSLSAASPQPAVERPAGQALPPAPEPGWWVESADGLCSERAALFAASQPAPLAVV